MILAQLSMGISAARLAGMFHSAGTCWIQGKIRVSANGGGIFRGETTRASAVKLSRPLHDWWRLPFVIVVNGASLWEERAVSMKALGFPNVFQTLWLLSS